MLKVLKPLHFALVFALFTTACATSEKLDKNTAEGAFALAQKFEKDERYEEAITYYSEVKNKYPYSRFATESELKIADIEFARENYPEAEAAYKLFKEFHPNHQRADYVTFQLGKSVFNQLPPTIDRDLGLASTCIEYFDQLLTSYPSSEYIAKANEFKAKAQKMLAEKANYIAQFYFVREKWQSALGRYEDLMRNFPKQGYDLSALYGATISAYKMRDLDRAKTYFKRLLAEFPDSKELAKARSELSDGF
jgi:outer membrane protein assembly factor BamD